MRELLNDFKSESLELLDQLESILEEVEEDPVHFKRLEEFGQIIDRIMGVAKTLLEEDPSNVLLNAFSGYGEVGKILGYKASQVHNNPELITITVAFLFDAVDILRDLLMDRVDVVEQESDTTFLDRLKWIASKFDANLRSSVAHAYDESVSDAEIAALLKGIGMKRIKKR